MGCCSSDSVKSAPIKPTSSMSQEFNSKTSDINTNKIENKVTSHQPLSQPTKQIDNNKEKEKTKDPTPKPKQSKPIPDPPPSQPDPSPDPSPDPPTDPQPITRKPIKITIENASDGNTAINKDNINVKLLKIDAKQTANITLQDAENATYMYTPISDLNDQIDINADPDKIEYQIKLEQQETERKFQTERKKHTRNQTLDVQLKLHQSRKFDSLYSIWKKYATNADKTKMNINSLTEALKVFGIFIDLDYSLQKFVFEQFDTENKKRHIDYNDFAATIASIVASPKDMSDGSLSLLFRVFDIDQDKYLEVEDLARILLTQNQIALVTTGTHKKKTNVVYTKKQCLKQAKRMITNNKDYKKYNTSINDKILISFEQFKSVMINKTDYDMIIDHMVQPSVSVNDIKAPRVSIL